MFGLYRLILAAMVLFQHFGDMAPIGAFAVKGFFCLSGFLMTMLMDTVYRDRLAAFTVNRFLRLYPTYWVASLLAICLLLFGLPPGAAPQGIPSGFQAVRTFFYINYYADTLPCPPSWAVTNEMVCYALIGLGISKTFWRSALWMAASCAYTSIVASVAPNDPNLNYFWPFAAMLPFSIGATIYHVRDKFPKEWAKTIAVACVAGMAVTVHFRAEPSTTTVFLLFAGFMAISLYNIKIPGLKSVDDWLGSLSYPLYLVHYSAAAIAAMLVGSYGHKRVAWTALGISLVMSWIVVILVDKPVNRLRNMVRSGAELKRKRKAKQLIEE